MKSGVASGSSGICVFYEAATKGYSPSDLYFYNFPAKHCYQHQNGVQVKNSNIPEPHSIYCACPNPIPSRYKKPE